MSDRTLILFGPPGTGKTTTLLNEVEEAVSQGISPTRIGFFAFTRKAAREATARAKKRFGFTDDDLAWFRTLHSAAFKMLGLHSDEVMQTHHYEDAMSGFSVGGPFIFEHQYNADIERVPTGGGRGDIALSMYSMARSRCIHIDDAWMMSSKQAQWEVSMVAARAFARRLDDYKRVHQILDFNDFLDEVYEELDLDLMIIDEAQDLTLQQWNFARRIGARAKRVILAGDDDQAIFQWAGADLSMFLRIRGERRVLPVSHRLPESVWSIANGISSRIRARMPKTWRPRADKGRVHYTYDPDHLDLSDGTWLLLSRVKHQLTWFEEICRTQGVVYLMNGQWSNQTPAVRAVLTYERLRRGETVSVNRAQDMARFLPGLYDVPNLPEVHWNDLRWPFEGMPDWMHVPHFETAIGDEFIYIKRLRRNNQSLVNPGHVVLSTIHGQKGGEADHVLLLSDFSKRVNEEFAEDADPEHRVWYVATSRAKQSLHIVNPRTTRHYVV